MLVIRLQRTGRSGHAMFRVVVQDSRKSPLSGKVISFLGHYDPHTKKVVIDKEKTLKFLENGAQPSNRMIAILKAEKIKLPSWVSADPVKKKAVKNADKRRSTAPKPVEKPAEEKVEAEQAAETPVEAEAAPGEKPAATETPAEEVKTEVEAKS